MAIYSLRESARTPFHAEPAQTLEILVGDVAPQSLSGDAAGAGTILSKVKAGLGCEDASVSADLYKVLVYDRGGFFLTHRDTEKADGMFGTLVVTLPSTYRGGALRIRHAGREVTGWPCRSTNPAAITRRVSDTLEE